MSRFKEYLYLIKHLPGAPFFADAILAELSNFLASNHPI